MLAAGVPHKIDLMQDCISPTLPRSETNPGYNHGELRVSNELIEQPLCILIKGQDEHFMRITNFSTASTGTIAISNQHQLELV